MHTNFLKPAENILDKKVARKKKNKFHLWFKGLKSILGSEGNTFLCNIMIPFIFFFVPGWEFRSSATSQCYRKIKWIFCWNFIVLFYISMEIKTDGEIFNIIYLEKKQKLTKPQLQQTECTWTMTKEIEKFMSDFKVKSLFHCLKCASYEDRFTLTIVAMSFSFLSLVAPSNLCHGKAGMLHNIWSVVMSTIPAGAFWSSSGKQNNIS